MKLLSLLLVAILLIPTPSFSTDYSKVLRSVRPLKADVPNPWTGQKSRENICTATSINDKEGYWLTADHCVDGGPTYIDGKEALIKYANSGKDLAVMYVAGVSVPPLKIASNTISIGDKVAMVGHPLGNDRPVLFKGRLAATGWLAEPGGQRYWMFEMQVCGGNSGSAVLNSNDEVVSVMQIAYNRPCSGFSGGVEWSDLVRFVGKYFKK